jgi:dATP/dGTP diphosphohydrolase
MSGNPTCEFCTNSMMHFHDDNGNAVPYDGFITKDSGKREEFASGMQRDTQDDKPRYDLLDLPMLKRWAELMARGAKKYGEHNWKKAAGEPELNRFKASAFRHLIQWLEGDTTEDHGAAVFFNIAGAEMVKARLGLK